MPLAHHLLQLALLLTLPLPHTPTPTPPHSTYRQQSPSPTISSSLRSCSPSSTFCRVDSRTARRGTNSGGSELGRARFLGPADPAAAPEGLGLGGSGGFL